MNHQVFGHTLRMLRTAAGLSLRDMAKKINVSPAYLCQVELGRQPPPTNERMIEIAKTIGIPESLLFDLSERPNPHILSLLRINPELNVLIQSARRSDLGAKDLLDISFLIQKLGKNGFRKFVHYGMEHEKDFLPFGNPAGDGFRLEELGRGREFSLPIDPGLVFADLDDSDKAELLHDLLKRVGNLHPSIDVEAAFKALMAREDEMSSGLGGGVAVPHIYVDGLRETVMVFGRIPEGLDFDAYDGRPVHFVCLILSPPEDRKKHLNLLAFLARRFLEEGFTEKLRKADSRDHILSLLFSDQQAIMN